MAFVAPRRPKSKSVTYRPTNGPTDQRTDTRSHRIASSRLTSWVQRCALFAFLVTLKRLYRWVCPSVRPYFRPPVGPYVTLLLFGILGATYGRASGPVNHNVSKMPYSKAAYYKKREGLGSPQWHFTASNPQCFSPKTWGSEEKIDLENL